VAGLVEVCFQHRACRCQGATVTLNPRHLVSFITRLLLLSALPWPSFCHPNGLYPSLPPPCWCRSGLYPSPVATASNITPSPTRLPPPPSPGSPRPPSPRLLHRLVRLVVHCCHGTTRLVASSRPHVHQGSRSAAMSWRAYMFWREPCEESLLLVACHRHDLVVKVVQAVEAILIQARVDPLGLRAAPNRLE
jgi:hypothetical protein